MARKSVKFEFDEASLKTLEQMQEEGYVLDDNGFPFRPEPTAIFGCDGRGPGLDTPHRQHVRAQLESRDREIGALRAQVAQLQDDNEKLQAVLSMPEVYAGVITEEVERHAFALAEQFKRERDELQGQLEAARRENKSLWKLADKACSYYTLVSQGHVALPQPLVARYRPVEREFLDAVKVVGRSEYLLKAETGDE